MTGKHPDLKEKIVAKKKEVKVRKYRTPAAEARAIKAGLHGTSELGSDYYTRQHGIMVGQQS